MWVNVKDKLPKIKDGEITSEDVLFAVADGSNRVFAGHYHTNGCFYSTKVSARTIYAENKYDISMLPNLKAEYWANFPKFD
jgi:hypothetical protein